MSETEKLNQTLDIIEQRLGLIVLILAALFAESVLRQFHWWI
jgi:hypothetical protein